MKILLDVMYGDKMMNEFMHHADVFEPSKQLAAHHQIELTGENINLDKTCHVMFSALTSNDKNVVFVAIRSVDGIRYVHDDKETYYIMPGINSISNGHNWGLFKDHLLTLGYITKTDERMRVLEIDKILTYLSHF